MHEQLEDSQVYDTDEVLREALAELSARMKTVCAVYTRSIRVNKKAPACVTCDSCGHMCKDFVDISQLLDRGDEHV